MNSIPRAVTARAKSAFSLKNPYPGWIESAPLAASAPQHRLGVDVALRDGLTAERVGLVGETHVERIPIEFGVDGDRGDPHLLRGADHSDGNFATIGDQDLLEHG